jgi:hypothetical protein
MDTSESPGEYRPGCAALECVRSAARAALSRY